MQVQAIVHVSGRACFQLRSEVVPLVVMMKRMTRSWTFENAAKTKAKRWLPYQQCFLYLTLGEEVEWLLKKSGRPYRDPS